MNFITYQIKGSETKFNTISGNASNKSILKNAIAQAHFYDFGFPIKSSDIINMIID